MKTLTEPTILAIDTSCDETSVAVVRGRTVLSNLLPSQMKYHRKFGGVVPTLAKLAHQERIDNVVKEAVERSGLSMKSIDAIAVTYGPGLAMALEIGINKAKELASEFSKPLIIVNHMEGHLLSAFADKNSKSQITRSKKSEPGFPVLGFLISGGHTEIILVKEFGNYEKIGDTLDDACGEAYDKCGRMLGLGYPAGPIITKFAKENRVNIDTKYFNKEQSSIVKVINKVSGNIYELSVPMAHTKDLLFSYSGLKTNFSRLLATQKDSSQETIKDLCSVFEAAALKQLTIKLEKAIKIHDPREVWLGGGVVASPRMRSEIREVTRKYKLKLRYPYTKKLTGDNAAMIGVVGAMKFSKYLENHKEKDIYLNEFEQIHRDPNLSF